MRARDWMLDALLALVLLAVGLIGTDRAGANQPGTAPVDTVALSLVAVAAAGLVVRRRWPLVTLALAAAALSVYLLRGLPYGPIMISFAIAVYSVAVAEPMRRSAVAAGLALVAILPHTVADLTGIVPASAWVVVPFALGVTVKVRRDSLARAREERARELASEERLRVAQEVHDVVGHGLAAIHMHAEIALHLLAKQPQQAETALSAISRMSKDALDELRTTLSVVRRGGEDRGPTPGLGQLDELRTRLTGTGLPVDVDVTGDPRDLPAAVDLAAYRIVQESLTNVLRHAGTATASVRVECAPDAVAVEVTNTGPERSERERSERITQSHGLTGMRERATTLGGTFEAGPVPGGGFRVYARLPLNGRP